MNDAASYVKTLETTRSELQAWLEDFSKKVTTQAQNTIESPLEAQEKLDNFEKLRKEFDIKAPTFDNLQKQGKNHTQ